MRLLPLFLSVFAAAGVVRPLPAAEPPRRNVVLLVADDLGFQLGCYGDRKVRTPHIDALAKSGVRFTHAFATVSSCSPSRASLYTGLYTHTNGQYGLAHAEHNFHTRANVASLPGLLRTKGYRSGILGKIHVLPQKVYNFDVEMTKDLAGNRSVARMGQQARQFFQDSGDKPFLLVAGFSDPHRSAKGFGNESPYPGVKETHYEPADVTVPYFLSDRPEVRQELADYYQAVSRLDQGVGFVLDALTESGHAGDTLVIFLSDNGPPFPGAKTTLYDSGIHLPLIISSPVQKKRGRTNAAMVSWVDVMPTILDWTGAKRPATLPGRSVLPILEEENPPHPTLSPRGRGQGEGGWEVVYGSHQFHEVTMYYPMRMIRTRTHKYLRNLAHPLDYPFASDLYNSRTWQGILQRGDKMMGERSVERFIHRPLEELYDLEKDPHERNNVAAGPKYAEVLKDLRRRLKEWQVRTRDPWMVKYRYE